jgi:hypothetical protein
MEKGPVDLGEVAVTDAYDLQAVDSEYPLGRDFVTRLETISAVSGRDMGFLGEHE